MNVNRENLVYLLKQNNLSLVVVCGNITEFGVAEGSPEPAGRR